MESLKILPQMELTEKMCFSIRYSKKSYFIFLTRMEKELVLFTDFKL